MSHDQSIKHITTVSTDWARFTVNHHEDEKYRKLALDSIKKLWRKWDIGRQVIVFIFADRMGRWHWESGWLIFSWKWNRAKEIYRRVEAGNEKWETVRNNNAPLQGQSKSLQRFFFFLNENFCNVRKFPTQPSPTRIHI